MDKVVFLTARKSSSLFLPLSFFETPDYGHQPGASPVGPIGGGGRRGEGEVEARGETGGRKDGGEKRRGNLGRKEESGGRGGGRLPEKEEEEKQGRMERWWYSIAQWNQQSRR